MTFETCANGDLWTDYNYCQQKETSNKKCDVFSCVQSIDIA